MSDSAGPQRDSDSGSAKQNTPGQPAWGKLLLLAVLLGLIGVAYYATRDVDGLDWLAQRESSLRSFQADHPVLIYAIAFAAYVLVTGLSLPGATVMTLLFAWYFGFWHGVILVSFASTAGATVAFLLSRYFFNSTFQRKFADKLRIFNREIEREGPFYLLTLRLLFVIPFFVINVVMGLTTIRTWTFWWVSQLGMLPGTIVYVYAGSRVPHLEELAEEGAAAAFADPNRLIQILSALAILGIFPLITRKLLQRFRPHAAVVEASSQSH